MVINENIVYFILLRGLLMKLVLKYKCNDD